MPLTYRPDQNLKHHITVDKFIVRLKVQGFKKIRSTYSAVKFDKLQQSVVWLFFPKYPVPQIIVKDNRKRSYGYP